MAHKQSISKYTFVTALLFILAPFLSAAGSIFKAKNERNLWCIFAIYILFGICFTINIESEFDSVRYVEQFREMNSGNLKDIYLANIIHNGDAGDIYFPIMAWIAKEIGGNNYHVLFGLVAIVFAIFTCKTIKIFYDSTKTNVWWMYSIMVFLLIMNNPVFNINGMRFWTAAWIFAYGLLSYYVERKKSGILWMVITPFVHLTFIFPIIIFIISQISVGLYKFWVLFLFFSVPFSFLSLDLIPFFSDYIPDIYLSKFDFYTNKEYIIERSSGIGFTYLENFLKISLMLWQVYCLYYIYKVKNQQQTFRLRGLLLFTIIFVSISNFLSAIPSVGRFIIVGFPFVFYLVWDNLDHNRVRKAFYILPFIMSFSIADMILNKFSLVLPSTFYFSNMPSLILEYL